MKKIFITAIILTIGIFNTSIPKELIDLKFIEMEVSRNGDVIGFSNYKFSKENNFLKVENETKFNVSRRVLMLRIVNIKWFKLFLFYSWYSVEVLNLIYLLKP